MKVFVVDEPQMDTNQTPWRFGGAFSTLDAAIAAAKNSWVGWIAWAGPFSDKNTHVLYGFQTDENQICEPKRFVITEYQLDEPFDY